MRIENVGFCTTAWDTVPAIEHKGETGTAGTSCQVAEDAEPHRSETKTGAKLFIVN